MRRYLSFAAATVLTLAAAATAAAYPMPTMEHANLLVNKERLETAQRQLKRDGDYLGKVDGKSGPRTIAAIERFQKQKGLKATGWLDQATWNTLVAQSLGRHPKMASRGARLRGINLRVRSPRQT